MSDSLSRRRLLQLASATGLAVTGGAVFASTAQAASYSSPVEVGSRYTSGYGWRDLDGNGTKENFHAGSDYAPPTPGQTGRPVYAAAAGTVVRRQTGAIPLHTGYGIVIDHGSYFSYYGHLAAYAVSNGASVAVGQRIGTMGATGNAQGIHLHFGIFTGSPSNPSFQNPHTWLANKGVIPGKTPPVTGGGGGTWPDVALPVTNSHTAASHAAWVKLMADIGYTNSSLTKNIQSWLKAKGFYTGVIDGVFGAMTVKALQTTLKQRGFYTGTIDGNRGPLTIRAEIAFLNDQRRFY
ncbi:peptidoglycan DD-metalloendopeptidase family protein [Parenemella sanctibonifatiensis]|uniref:Uncharacterized protein n=1 Tax=Parenemella sanctibonifatiensis TaxID=2016505 RepID=A0A255E7G8_9ACTN|nr:peptidoglycan DD-metalloendopeptidase family protein [Parenemella sanctibonifatiensis]OYN87518.1 hypothetical protein CGZ92_07335 [Parenemella sanctibonifatiensis]